MLFLVMRRCQQRKFACAGDWSQDASSRRRICYWQLFGWLIKGMSPLKACNQLSDSYSAGILLAELAIGELPFAGDETLLSEDGMDAEQCNAFTRTVFLQSRNAAWVS